MKVPTAPVTFASDLATDLTKREHFAACALQGLLANSECELPNELLVASVIDAADKLIAALNAGQQGVSTEATDEPDNKALE